MNLTITPNQYSQTVFTGRGNRARKIARKIEQRLPYIKRQQAKREGWRKKGEFIKNLSATSTAVGSAIIASQSVKQRQQQEEKYQTRKQAQKPEEKIKKEHANDAIESREINKKLKKLEQLDRPEPTLSAYSDYFHKFPYTYSPSRNFDLCDGCKDETLVDTFDFQKRIAYKIVTTPSLRDLFRHYALNELHSQYILLLPPNLCEKDKLMSKFEEMTDAKIKLIDEYANNEKWQNYHNEPWRKISVNDCITDKIADIVTNTNSIEYSDFIIDTLNKMVNGEKFDNMSNTNLLYYITKGVDINLIKKIASNEKLSKYLDRYDIVHIYAKDKNNAKKIIQILDVYIDKYSDSEYITQDLRVKIYRAFNFSVDPVKYVEDWMDNFYSNS